MIDVSSSGVRSNSVDPTISVPARQDMRTSRALDRTELTADLSSMNAAWLAFPKPVPKR